MDNPYLQTGFLLAAAYLGVWKHRLYGTNSTPAKQALFAQIHLPVLISVVNHTHQSTRSPPPPPLAAG